VDLDGARVVLRRAVRPDLPALVALLAADDLGATRDGIRGPADRDAYERPSAPSTRTPTWSIAEARRRGCALVQLTTDKTRTDARRFYDRLGFAASHEGLKLDLTDGNGSVSP
jgi:hypothetical protein